MKWLESLLEQRQKSYWKKNEFKYPFEEKKRTLTLVNGISRSENILYSLGIGYIILALFIWIGSILFDINYKEVLFTVTIVAFIMSLSDLIKVSATMWYIKNKIYNFTYNYFLNFSEFIFSLAFIAIIIFPLILKLEVIQSIESLYLIMDILTILTFGIMLITIEKNNYINRLIYKSEKDSIAYKKIQELQKRIDEREELEEFIEDSINELDDIDEELVNELEDV